MTEEAADEQPLDDSIPAMETENLPLLPGMTTVKEANTASSPSKRRRTQKTTLLIMSDTHNLGLEDLDPSHPLRQPIPKVDVLLHCGDLTQVGGLSAYKKALKLLGSFDAELKLVIAGNHDLELDEKYWRTHLEEDDDPEQHQGAVDIMTGELAKEAGVTYSREGSYDFTLEGGARFSLYASPYQPECGDWAFGYPRTEDGRFTLPQAEGPESFERDCTPGVDIVMTHGPSKGILDLIPSEQEHAGCEALLHAVERTRPLINCFGHIHEGYGTSVVAWEAGMGGAEEKGRMIRVAQAGALQGSNERWMRTGRTTLMVNAAIMDEKGSPRNKPWVVELELPADG